MSWFSKKFIPAVKKMFGGTGIKQEIETTAVKVIEGSIKVIIDQVKAKGLSGPALQNEIVRQCRVLLQSNGLQLADSALMALLKKYMV
jgi:hypothetical protein